MFEFFKGYFGSDLAIDLGTANTLIYVRGKGIVLQRARPSSRSGRKAAPTARGDPGGRARGQADARTHAGEHHGYPGPMKDGVIARLHGHRAMLKQFIKKVLDSRLFSTLVPRIIICVPCGSTQVERRADSRVRAGRRALEGVT
jgi:rod shape-determining protein MreB